ncbi:MAG: IgG-blocking protein M, partial [Ureaplasma sp.]|nr:IgG-blocking protein M [Ureaplasma sp.]
TSLSGLVVSAAITTGIIISKNNNSSLQSVESSTAKPQLQTSKFQFRALSDSSLENISDVDYSNYKVSERITKDFNSGYVKTPILNYDGSVSYEERYQTNCYYNQRDFMPILSSFRMYNYPNERLSGDALNGEYYGWNKSNQYFNSNGSIANQNDWAANYVNYVPRNELKEWSKSNGNLVQELIKGLQIDCSKFNSVEQINSYLEKAQKMGVEFITIKSPTQNQIEQIIIPNGIKKLTIVDYDKKIQSHLTSFRGIVIPESVIELEFYSNSCRKFDPLILNSSTHMIYDHIESLASGIKPVNFSTIDLSSHKNLSQQDLQRAIDIVYVERQFERNFQGEFSGGYIYQLDISNTPIKSLNSVRIPSQSDGRFNIAYVKWSSSTQNGEISIGITNSDKPTNDSLVGEWYDDSNNSSAVTKLFVQTTEPVAIELAKKEILGQIKKYPNINEVDLKGVKLSDNKKLSDLVIELKESLTDSITNTIIKDINYIINDNIVDSEVVESSPNESNPIVDEENTTIDIFKEISSDISFRIKSNEIIVLTTNKVDYETLAQEIVKIATEYPNIHQIDLTYVDLLDDENGEYIDRSAVVYAFSEIIGDEIAKKYSFILNNGMGHKEYPEFNK